MRHRPSRAGFRALATLLLWILPAAATASEFFGTYAGLQLQPEIDAIYNAGTSFRIVGKVEPTFTPSAGNDVLGFSLYFDWLVAPFTGAIVSPDLAKRRRLDTRFGISWYPTAVAGEAGWTDVLRLEGEATVRTDIPGGILATYRTRVEAQWQLDTPTSFTWRLRLRPQLEREFVLSRAAGTSLTPFANVEFIWTTSQDMWAQFRMQVGLQLGVQWFGKGQVIELNGQAITHLQPVRSTSPVIGLVWYQYF